MFGGLQEFPKGQAYQRGNAKRIGVYETNRGVYKMSLIPIMIANKAYRQDNVSIEYIETPAMQSMFSKEFQRLVSNLELDIHTEKHMVSIPERF